MCDRVQRHVCRCCSHPTSPRRRRGGLLLPAPVQEQKGLPGSGPTEPCTNRHTHGTSMMDTKMSSITLLASELKDGDYERPSIPHQNKLLGLRAPAFNWIDRCE